MVTHENPLNLQTRFRARRRAKKISSERYERSAKRKVSRKRWQQSEAGKKSMHDRGERYRHTEKGVKNSRKKAMTYYYAHKDDPEFKAKRAARQRKYRAEAKARKLGSKAPPVTEAAENRQIHEYPM